MAWNGFGSTSANFYLTGGNVQFSNYGGGPTLSGTITVDPSTTFTMNTGGGNSGIMSGLLAGSGVIDYIGGGQGRL